jgi:hypothetical protein
MKHVKFLGADAPYDDGCAKCPECLQPRGHDGKCDCSCYGMRTYWFAEDLTRLPKDEPFLFSLAKFRLHKDRYMVESPALANLISSKTRSDTQRPIIDLDFPHTYVPSNTPGHAHLYLNKEISQWRWFILMVGLYIGGVVDKGGFWWTLRRRSNFVRLPGVLKDDTLESPTLSYGWLFKRRKPLARPR